uniref:Elongation of very long chain fatty acids protein n=1 Tax=Vespula pensylvanica TaxID=30213 RepID=A0A834PDR5_VESPE|nr:hypothetical protein H0235_000145 [Vespula pensylvanica]
MSLLGNMYNEFVENVDSRVKLLPLVGTSFAVPTIIAVYFLVIYFGPIYMNDRPAYSLKRFIQFYNIFQILANSIIIYMYIDGGWYKDVFIYCVPITYSTDAGSMKGGWFTKLSIFCEPIVYNTDPANMELLNACWWACLTKFIDLIETGIFVLRKKDSQISFLHLYHHISTVLISWIFGKHYAAGMATFLPLVNCSIHVIMYTYYFLSTCGPSFQKIIHRYKFLLTITQMGGWFTKLSIFCEPIVYSTDPANMEVQFVILICHVSQSLSPNCDIDYTPVNSFIVFKLIKGGWFTKLSIFCEPIAYSTDPANMELLSACWWACLTKFIDLIETGIFVLRKKDSQISFLHLYHHISTVLISWIFGKHYAAGMATFLPLVNCSIHVIMYTYYFLSTCGPSVQKIIHRYKFLLTITQMDYGIKQILQVAKRMYREPLVDGTSCEKRPPRLKLWLFGSLCLQSILSLKDTNVEEQTGENTKQLRAQTVQKAVRIANGA